MTAQHEHDYEYQGVATWPSERPRPGSGAHDRHYGDVYYCRLCCATLVRNERVIGNTYEHALDGAVAYERRPI